VSFVACDDLRERDAQPVHETQERPEGRVDLAALDRADVVAMEAGTEAKVLLGDDAAVAQLANGGAEGVGRRTRAVNRLADGAWKRSFLLRGRAP
jgi:hypothetical protein